MLFHARFLIQLSLMPAAVLCGAAMLAQTAQATGAEAAVAAAPADPWQFKLTASHYNTRSLPAAQDINLRGSRQDITWWVAHYRRGSEFEQSRTGWEQKWAQGWGQLTSSLQLATHGFAGGALSAQLGSEALYGLVGWGRTNLKDYYNLNFDPNDAITLGWGGKLPGGNAYTVFTVKDDRLHTGQQISHTVLRMPLQPSTRLTLDYAYKRGRASEESTLVRGHSLAVGLDVQDVFVRVTSDQKVNFSPNKQIRVAVGLRF